MAIKVLQEVFANAPDRLASFVREAQLLVSLNQPNIAAIYGIEERAIVMELIEGPTPEDRIAAGFTAMQRRRVRCRRSHFLSGLQGTASH